MEENNFATTAVINYKFILLWTKLSSGSNIYQLTEGLFFVLYVSVVKGKNIDWLFWLFKSSCNFPPPRWEYVYYTDIVLTFKSISKMYPWIWTHSFKCEWICFLYCLSVLCYLNLITSVNIMLCLYIIFISNWKHTE